MISSVLTVKIVDSPAEAPTYSEECEPLKLDTCLVVGRGTEGGNPTVDLQMTDESGNQYVAIITGNLIESLGKIVAAKRQIDDPDQV